MDVAVEGSEVTGFNAIIELAKAGVPVVAIDQHRIREGASSRNAVITASTAYQLRKYGAEATRLLTVDHLHEEIGSSLYIGSLVRDFYAKLDPEKYTCGLTVAAV